MIKRISSIVVLLLVCSYAHTETVKGLDCHTKAIKLAEASKAEALLNGISETLSLSIQLEVLNKEVELCSTMY